jgi:hypothetical protein
MKYRFKYTLQGEVELDSPLGYGEEEVLAALLENSDWDEIDGRLRVPANHPGWKIGDDNVILNLDYGEWPEDTVKVFEIEEIEEERSLV